MNELLKLSEFKSQLLRFLFKGYEDPIYGPIIGDKVFYSAIDNACKRFYTIDGTLRFEEVHELYGNHLEGDTCHVSC